MTPRGGFHSQPDEAAMRAMWPKMIGYCPYGNPAREPGYEDNDRLWVRETCIISPKRFDGAQSVSYNATDQGGDGRIVQYIASTPDTDAARDYGLKATPSIHMPRWASRITLEITEVRVERLQDISHEDAWAEGINAPGSFAVEEYRRLWDSLNEKRGYGWDANPWVWVVAFRRLLSERAHGDSA
jgi:hypothetical protein